MPRSLLEIKKQEMRQLCFPDDRIAFKKSYNTATEDTRAMEQYINGEITFRALRRQVAKNNYLDGYFEDGLIPENMMRNELRIMGWDIQER